MKLRVNFRIVPEWLCSEILNSIIFSRIIYWVKKFCKRMVALIGFCNASFFFLFNSKFKIRKSCNCSCTKGRIIRPHYRSTLAKRKETTVKTKEYLRTIRVMVTRCGYIYLCTYLRGLQNISMPSSLRRASVYVALGRQMLLFVTLLHATHAHPDGNQPRL